MPKSSLILVLMLLISMSAPGSDKEVKENASSVKAYNFVKIEELGEVRKNLLTPFLLEKFDVESWDLQAWIEKNDGLSAAYYSISKALESVFVGQKESRLSLIQMVKKVVSLEKDRMRVIIPRELFQVNVVDSRNYWVEGAVGYKEDGKFTCSNGTDMRASLHDGYEIQCYTKTKSKNMPRLQINYSFTREEAEIDLDGFRPWVLIGIIPNFRHLTSGNSDTRSWYKTFLRKFGHPGFEVK